ncbi:hypothetical protein AMAG_03829 [Allomyces macrogynus ATCC 38327]|uniref:Uncharacterized protein n=1 Tax=Allomyces macrogynus (strain ATCC 38327) TaxID=578462 RepID=A0A0L0SAP7_ALLM3|nr:hypothetical protein AMAG_03829 [Allomyces macrogynus ATCC 38327]|eukprot:KNE59566.1 hypothetical protein AMAG_03829 [Allomyces macrogynus ATCC 38327]
MSTPTATLCLTPISTRPRGVTPAQQRALAELDAHMWSVPPPNSRFETLTRPTPRAYRAPTSFTKSACALIEKILDLGTVRMDSKVADFLDTDGVLPLFVNYLTRIPSSDDAEDDPEVAERGATQKTDRNADLVPTMRSYHVMEMLSATHPVNAQFADRHLAEIVTLLLDALAPNSDANLYHFAKVLETLVKRWPVRVIDRLVYTTRADPPLLRLIPHLGHPAVSAVLLTCLLHAAPENPRERAMRFSHLDDTGFLDALVQNLDSPNELLACMTVDFLRQLVEEGMRCDNCNDLFRALTTRPTILDHLLDLIEHGKPYQRRAVVAFLHALVVKMIPKPPTTMSSSFGQGDSSLTILAASIAHSLVPALSILTDYVTRCPALSSSQHLTALELLLLVMNAATTQDLERHVSAAFWHHLADTALVTCPTAVILAVYYRLIHGLLGRGSVALVRAALIKPKVMLRLIGYYVSALRASSRSRTRPGRPDPAPTNRPARVRAAHHQPRPAHRSLTRAAVVPRTSVGRARVVRCLRADPAPRYRLPSRPAPAGQTLGRPTRSASGPARRAGSRQDRVCRPRVFLLTAGHGRAHARPALGRRLGVEIRDLLGVPGGRGPRERDADGHADGQVAVLAATDRRRRARPDD